MEIYQCDCNEKCFIYTFKNRVVYRCDQINEEMQTSKCNFYKEIMLDNQSVGLNKVSPIAKKIPTPIKITSRYSTKNLKDLCESFLITQKLETFQEIEMLSKQKFDPNKEHILEYIFKFIPDSKLLKGILCDLKSRPIIEKIEQN